ncbi:M1 family metallopeptidase [Streptomyces sp. NPDC093109]|uniref:M1 family metallopeptidase n=1 Tax=Streptomyces sp. NPDC093109 TaxID=3154977 RepID=UPI00344DD0F1
MLRPPAATRPLVLPLVLLVLASGCTGDGTRAAAGPAGPAGHVGAAGLGDPYFPGLGNGGYDVEHYGLTLDYTPATGRLKGVAEITARATQDLGAFNLDFAGMTVDSATVDGASAAVRRDGTELTLRPRARLGRGDTFRTVVRYSGVPRRITDADGSQEGWLVDAAEDGRRVVALGEPTGSMAWFPGNHHPSDKASYDITVTVPAGLGLKAVSNGELRSERTRDGRTSFAWHEPAPMASYLATVAIGPYRTKATAGTKNVVPLYTAVDPTVVNDSAALLAAVPRVMKWSERNFGPYPFSSGGLIIGRPGDAEYALETQTRPFLPGPTATETLVHEVAHQWFGNSVTPKTWRDMWLSEGFATYAEWLWLAETEGVPVGDSFAEAYADQANWAFPPAVPPSAARISDPPVYGRGAMVLQRVREAVGDDTFFRIVRGWAREHRHGNAGTGDFTAYVEREAGGSGASGPSGTAGRKLESVWDAWLYGKAKPPLG